MRNYFFIILFTLLLQPCLGDFAYGKDLDLHRNEFFLGPSWCYVKRTKRGGTEQNGNMGGITFGYDRLKRYGWYVGVGALYAEGTLKGVSGAEKKLKSHMTDTLLEGRFGYTFQQKHCWKISFTPFIGGGYYVEKNHFSLPRELPIHYKKYFPYAASGFLLKLYPWQDWELGSTFTTRFPIEPKCRVSHDPDNEATTQNINERFQYRIDLSIVYRFCGGPWAVGAIPFYEYRQYGGHPNFPFDFIKTKFSLWGITFVFKYQLENLY